MSTSAQGGVTPTVFDLTGPLPVHSTVLEASAGTGKTYAIAALATRYVAAGRSLDELLLVTFTRLATGELRERVRDRLAATEAGLSRLLDGAPAAATDELVTLLGNGSQTEVRERRDRLTAAITDFDAATIETTHSFCQRILAELGTLGDLEPDVRFLDRDDELLDEVVDDLYLRLFTVARSVAPIGREQALAIARVRAHNPTDELYPLDPEPRGAPALRRWLAEQSLTELEARKRRLRVMTHSDQLTRLLAVLRGPNGGRAAERLRARFTVVLIDEFQDTDPVQWEILQRAFGDGPATLVLIGDPKQAIYSFRGADVFTYLSAARQATQRATLIVNHRSDGDLLTALNALFGGAALGHPEIPYRDLRPAPGHERTRLRGNGGTAPLRLRLIDSTAPIARTKSGKYFDTAATRKHVAADLAADVARQLDGGLALVDGDGARPLAPGDVAVLVREHRQADAVHAALIATGVPAVISGAGSVFATPAAADWQALLSALQRPSDRAAAARVALSAFVGWDGEQLALADHAALDGLHVQLHSWARVLREQGVASLLSTIVHSEQLPARLLAQTRGDRRLTDLQHIGELLHQRQSRDGIGVAALAGWLAQRIVSGTGQRESDELTRRLDTDVAAVHVLTIHAAKGLEFPVLYCPYLWDGRTYATADGPVYFHPDGDGHARAIDVALEGDEFGAHARTQLDESRGEDLRLAYVALTRARHQVVLWWTAGPFYAFESPLGRLLFARDAHGTVAVRGPSPRPSERVVNDRLSELVARAGGQIVVEHVVPASERRPPARADVEAPLAVAVLERALDDRWQRTSYTALTAAAHAEAAAVTLPASTPAGSRAIGSEPDSTPATDDEPGFVATGDGYTIADGDTTAVNDTGGAGGETAGAGGRVAADLPLAALRAGPAVGTVIHRALELAEFDAANLPAALQAALVDANPAAETVLGAPLDAAAAGLARALSTPLGGSLGEFSLRELARSDRLDELEFELPLAGGETPHGELRLAGVAATLAAELEADDPFVDYPERLRELDGDRALRGYLTGTIDLIARVIDPHSGRPRFHVLDYKTNWLAAPGARLQAEHYRPAALTAEMIRSDYVLQALLYSVALHRYLRWRLPGYDPSRDLGGVHYLFLRGMSGPAVGTTSAPGVCHWQPAARLIIAVSEVLDGR